MSLYEKEIDKQEALSAQIQLEISKSKKPFQKIFLEALLEESIPQHNWQIALESFQEQIQSNPYLILEFLEKKAKLQSIIELKKNHQEQEKIIETEFKPIISFNEKVDFGNFFSKQKKPLSKSLNEKDKKKGKPRPS